MLENFIVDALAKEIAEFLEDKKDLAETKVKLIKEAKNKFAEVKQNFHCEKCPIKYLATC